MQFRVTKWHNSTATKKKSKKVSKTKLPRFPPKLSAKIDMVEAGQKAATALVAEDLKPEESKAPAIVEGMLAFLGLLNNNVMYIFLLKPEIETQVVMDFIYVFHMVYLVCFFQKILRRPRSRWIEVIQIQTCDI